MTQDGSSRTKWASALDEELAFWRESLSSPDTPAGAEHRARLERRPVPDWIKVAAGDADPVWIIDVGSGPLTTLGTEWPGRNVFYDAADPLADGYNEILDELGLVPPARPVYAEAERLTEQFPSDHYHVVHAANSLDHCSDPVEAIRQMAAITRPGGVLQMSHHVNVGELEGYHGLHQWNLCPDGDDVVIWNSTGRTMLSSITPGWSRTMIDHGNGIFTVALRKPEPSASQ